MSTTTASTTTTTTPQPAYLLLSTTSDIGFRNVFSDDDPCCQQTKDNKIQIHATHARRRRSSQQQQQQQKQPLQQDTAPKAMIVCDHKDDWMWWKRSLSSLVSSLVSSLFSTRTRTKQRRQPRRRIMQNIRRNSNLDKKNKKKNHHNHVMFFLLMMLLSLSSFNKKNGSSSSSVWTMAETSLNGHRTCPHQNWSSHTTGDCRHRRLNIPWPKQSVTTTIATTTTMTGLAMILRGGDTSTTSSTPTTIPVDEEENTRDQETRTTTTMTTTGDTVTIQQREQTQHLHQQQQKQEQQRFHLLSLFQLHNAIKTSIGRCQDDDKNKNDDDDNEEEDDEQEDELNLFHNKERRDSSGSSSKRGGAFMPKPTPVPTQLSHYYDNGGDGGWGRRLFQWFLTPTSTTEQDKQSTLHSSSPIPQSSLSSSSSSSISRVRQDLERMWWNQAWMDQMPQAPVVKLSQEQQEVQFETREQDEDENKADALLRKENNGLSATTTTGLVGNDDDNDNKDDEQGYYQDMNDKEEDGSNDIVIVFEEEEKEVVPLVEDKNVGTKKKKNTTTETSKSLEQTSLLVATRKKKKKTTLQQQQPKEDMETESGPHERRPVKQLQPAAAATTTPLPVTEAIGKQEGVNEPELQPVKDSSTSMEGDKSSSSNTDADDVIATTTTSDPTPYSSSGAWVWIDAFLTAGYSTRTGGGSDGAASWKPSRSLRPVRKAVARWTGMHGVLSGKHHRKVVQDVSVVNNGILVSVQEEGRKKNKKELRTSIQSSKDRPVAGSDGQGMVITATKTKRETEFEQVEVVLEGDQPEPFWKRRLAAIEKARQNVARVEAEKELKRRPRRFAFWGQGRGREEQPFGGRDEDDDSVIIDLDDDKKKKKKSDHATREVAVGTADNGTRSSRGDRRYDVATQTDNPQQTHQLDEQQVERERLKEIDRLLERRSQQMAALATEKDLILNMLNPLWNYTTATSYDELNAARRRQQEQESQEEKVKQGSSKGKESIVAQKKFNFPNDDLVDEYITMLVSSERLIKLNHSDLWRNGDAADNDNDDKNDDDLDDEDEWLTGEELAKRRRSRERTTAEQQHQKQQQQYPRNGEHAGSRWLRIQGLGEKIGLAIEDVAYKVICFQVMGVLARGLGSLHGINVMGHADIGIKAEQAPILPPNLATGPYCTTDSYARQAFQNAISSKSRKKRKTQRNKNNHDPYCTADAADAVQRHAVIETLLSQCQVAAPLLKLFPLVWQRALIGNLVIVITAVLTDFLEGLELQVLGHRLEVKLKPITEQDIMKRLQQRQQEGSSSLASPYYYNGDFRERPQGLGSSPYWSQGGDGGRQDPYNIPFADMNDEEDPARSYQAFEAAVQATAADLAGNLKFLDKWHERVFLGGDSIRLQVATLIARVVLSLVDDILSDARLDLWSSSSSRNGGGGGGGLTMLNAMMGGGGPRLKAGLYYRTTTSAR